MSQVEGLLQRLKEHPFLREFGEAGLRRVAECAREVTHEAGAVLAQENASADTFYLIRYGTVAVELSAPGRGRLTIQTVGEGEILGWSWLVPPHRWTFSARAVTLVRAVALDAECLRARMEADHELGYRLLQRFVPMMASRLSAARIQMLDLYAPPGRDGR